MITMIRRLIRSIRNLIFWFPTIVKDQDYDFAFMFVIWAKKLESMELDTANWITASTEKDRVRIKTARILCQRLANETPYNARNIIFPNKNGVKRFYYDRMRQQDIELLTDYIRRYSLGWWD
jgi:hypothetical protein